MSLLEQLRQGVTTATAEETRGLAARLAPLLPPDTTLALHGDLGAGKTTFVQGLAHGLGLTEPVTSPTFNIYTVHRAPAGRAGAPTLVHLDAYRLENARQIEDLTRTKTFLVVTLVTSVAVNVLLALVSAFR